MSATASAAAASVAVAIPAFDAAPWIDRVVRRVCTLGFARPLVVDDGSADGTAAIAEAAGAEVLRHSRNLGKGAALRTAFVALFGRGRHAVVTLDADGQHVPEQIPRLIDAWAAARAHLVLGSRDHLFAAMSPLRRRSNRLSSRAISFAAGQRLGDVQTGFRLYSAELYRVLGFPGWRFEAESAIVVRAARSGMRIVAVPIELAVVDGRATSHYRPILDSLRIAGSVTRARFQGSALHNAALHVASASDHQDGFRQDRPT